MAGIRVLLEVRLFFGQRNVCHLYAPVGCILDDLLYLLFGKRFHRFYMTAGTLPSPGGKLLIALERYVMVCHTMTYH